MLEVSRLAPGIQPAQEQFEIDAMVEHSQKLRSSLAVYGGQAEEDWPDAASAPRTMRASSLSR